MDAKKVYGSGSASTARKVLQITVSEALSAPPRLKCFDNPDLNSTTGRLFAGTAGNGMKPMLSAVATTDAAPAAGWKPSVAVNGGATANLLKGDDSYVNLSSTAPVAGGSVTFNLNLAAPFDIPLTESLAFVLLADINYSGAAPILTWRLNSASDGGTEASPVWTTFAVGINGIIIKFTDAGGSLSTLTFHRPPSGIYDPPELWLLNP